MTDVDVVVIGAGFAGATAARELATRGRSVLVLEATDHLGGRTRTAQLSDGEMVELGGTFLHWTQPHVYAEITRYGLNAELIDGVEPSEWSLTPSSDGGLGWLPSEQQSVREQQLLELFYARSRDIMPRPYQPMFARDEVLRADTMTLQNRLDELELSEADAASLTALLSSYTMVPPSEGSFLANLRWWAPAGHEYGTTMESAFGFKLARGTVSLVSAIIADGGAEVRLGTPVTAVRQRQDGIVEVETAHGDIITARAVVSAVPTGVWPDIEFDPPLAPDRLAATAEGMQTDQLSKGYLVLRGEPRRVSVLPRWKHPIIMLFTSHRRSEDEQVMVFWGSDLLGEPTLDAVDAAVRELLPGTEVVEVVARRYWSGDPYNRGGWGVLKPGQLGRFEPHRTFIQPQGRLFFATADIATGWTGYIDGAVETGLVAARKVGQLLDGPAA